MKGLLRKDFYLLARYGRTYGILIAMFLALYTFGKHGFFYFGYPTILVSLMGLTLTSLDEHARWDKYSDSLPVTRAQTVSGKYIILGILVLATALLTAAVSLIFARRIGTSVQTSLYLSAMIAGIGLGLPSITMPLVFKFGTEKARWVSLLATGFCIALFFIVGNVFFENLFDDMTYAPTVPLETMPLALPAGLVLYAASWLLSVKIYRKREL